MISTSKKDSNFRNTLREGLRGIYLVIVGKRTVDQWVGEGDSLGIETQKANMVKDKVSGQRPMYRHDPNTGQVLVWQTGSQVSRSVSYDSKIMVDYSVVPTREYLVSNLKWRCFRIEPESNAPLSVTEGGCRDEASLSIVLDCRTSLRGGWK